jgi:hypothetical protein
MAAHLKLDRRRAYLCEDGLRMWIVDCIDIGDSITLSLPCGEQKKQNPPREALGSYTGDLRGVVRVNRTG